MIWFRGLPTKPGIYLRRNPPVSFVVRQDLVMVDGKLCTGGTTDELTLVRLEKWPGAKTFQWYGPIPYPPEVENDQ